MQTQIAGLDLGTMEFLLVKFHFTNPALVPDGVKHIRRRSERELIRKRMEMLRMATPADTCGTRVADNLMSTSAEHFFEGLRAAGLLLLDVYNWEQTKAGRRTKYVVNFVWGRPQEGLEEGVSVNADAFTRDVVWFCHIWQNPTKTDAIDFVGRQPGQKAKHEVLVEGNRVVVCPV